jgi:hypothetical protein
VAQDEGHSVHIGTTGGSGGSGPEPERDPEKARAFIEREGRESSDGKVDEHEADAGADLGAGEGGADTPDWSET